MGFIFFAGLEDVFWDFNGVKGVNLLDGDVLGVPAFVSKLLELCFSLLLDFLKDNPPSSSGSGSYIAEVLVSSS